MPLANLVVDPLHHAGVLSRGAAYWLGRRLFAVRPDAQRPVAGGLRRRRPAPEEEAAAPGGEDPGRGRTGSPGWRWTGSGRTADPARSSRPVRRKRAHPLALRRSSPPGNIYDDVVQAQAAAQAGADVIAVIRSTAQSLLDHVPYGATTEGFGGTFATQENFRIMREALDEVEPELGRYVRLVNYCSGLCMPEIAAMGGAASGWTCCSTTRMYGILFRDINTRRTLIDQYFSRRIIAVAGIVINTGEDNYLTTADAVEQAHTVLASQFINERFAHRRGPRGLADRPRPRVRDRPELGGRPALRDRAGAAGARAVSPTHR